MSFQLRIPNEDESEFVISPVFGSIEPFSSIGVQLDFKPNHVMSYSNFLVVDVDLVGVNMYQIPIFGNSIVSDVILF